MFATWSKIDLPAQFCADNDDESSAVISRSAPTQPVRANVANQSHPSLSQDPPHMPCTFNHVGRVHWRLWRPARHHQKRQFFLLSLLGNSSSLFPSKGAAGRDSDISKRHRGCAKHPFPLILWWGGEGHAACCFGQGGEGHKMTTRQ